MKDGKCSKNYPKNFSDTTVSDESGFPKYKRPYGGRVVSKGDIILDNQWVVPHNLDLFIKYNAHINVEICNTVKSVKYIYKYVYKGHDRANVAISQASNATSITTADVDDRSEDEIRQYLDARYVSAAEACWRLFHFSLHQEYPPHQRLQIHLSGEQTVYYHEIESNLGQTVQRGRDRLTTLTAWFRYNQHHAEARQYLYVEFPEHFV
jgi:hypothetical protein